MRTHGHGGSGGDYSWLLILVVIVIILYIYNANSQKKKRGASGTKPWTRKGLDKSGKDGEDYKVVDVKQHKRRVRTTKK